MGESQELYAIFFLSDKNGEPPFQVVENASALHIDISKGLVVNGLSAGAMFAIILTQRARADPAMKDKITGQILQIPPTCHAGPDGYPEK